MPASQILSLAVGLLGGLAIFMFGIELLTDNLKVAAGDRLRVLLGRLTRTRLSALFAGTVFTGVVQSSSVTTVLTISFVAAGLMSFQNFRRHAAGPPGPAVFPSPKAVPWRLASGESRLTCSDLRAAAADAPHGAAWPSTDDAGQDGVHAVAAAGLGKVYCDMTLDGGGWMR